jgi:hypothetical protein
VALAKASSLTQTLGTSNTAFNGGVMRKTQIVIFLAFLSIALFDNAYAQPTENTDATSSVGLTPESVPAPTPKLTDIVDFTELRETFAKRADYETLCEAVGPANEWKKAMDARNYSGAYNIVTKLLSRCPVDARFHLRGIDSLKELGRTDKITEHKRWWIGLTDSVLKSGDGKTPQTALVTISIGEEYATLIRLGLKRGKQSLVNGPPLVDMHIVQPVNDSTKRVTIYFNPHWHFIRLTHRVN